ncbi:hypothetical protein Poly24_16560 [Rosistilla carotiformis]|uniref:DinB superfamily protein n=1 Tax=Rosistilla carotiformis TaxID=2528017 RepID=A0A518JQY0_9BACT|nr:hypothetical protein Poly24_16560 [Rosistilla carotiformis]
MERRTLDLRSAADVIADIQHLRAVGYTQTKRWNLTHICQHLDATMTGGMDGFGFRLPWIARRTLVKWGFAYALKKRKLFSGAPTFPFLQPTASNDQDDNEMIDHCIATIARAGVFNGSMEDYALLDGLSADDWREFMWIHAAHHLSFLVPHPDA